jgi:hypothetical protein
MEDNKPQEEIDDRVVNNKRPNHLFVRRTSSVRRRVSLVPPAEENNAGTRPNLDNYEGKSSKRLVVTRTTSKRFTLPPRMSPANRTSNEIVPPLNPKLIDDNLLNVMMSDSDVNTSPTGRRRSITSCTSSNGDLSTPAIPSKRPSLLSKGASFFSSKKFLHSETNEDQQIPVTMKKHELKRRRSSMGMSTSSLRIYSENNEEEIKKATSMESNHLKKGVRRLSVNSVFTTWENSKDEQHGDLSESKKDLNANSSNCSTATDDSLEDDADKESRKEVFEDDLLTEEWSPNTPHPSLEYPLLYFLLKCFPTGLMIWVRNLYRIRWELSYPLQRRVPFSKILRKVGVSVTWGELILWIPFVVILIQGMISSFINPSVTQSGIVARLPLAICFLTANHNSLLTLLLGIPFERALKYHKVSGYCAFLNGIFHTYVAFAVGMEPNGAIDGKLPLK